MTRKTILCVDDEFMILDSLKEQLKRFVGEDYDIEVAESGEEALDLLEEISVGGGEVPIIISDQIMPGMKGDELLMTVHGRFPSTLKIFLTGRAEADDVGNALNKASLYRYISKPWDREDLNLTISEALRSYYQEKELSSHRENLEDLIKQRTLELERTQRQLVVKERLAFLGQLTTLIGHELRNPLGTVRTSIFAIKEHCSCESSLIPRALERAERNVVRCDQVIEQLLEYSGVHEDDLESVDIDELINHLLDAYAMPSGIVLKRQLNSKVKVRLGKERFRRSFLNVLDNACDAMTKKNGQDSDKNQLTVSSRCTEGRVEIRLRDQGTGIAKEDLEKIFSPHFSSKALDIGLGLPIAKQIMEQHNGGIEFQSEPNKGTTVTLWLPIES